MTLLQQQQNSAHNNSHVNQIGTITSSVGSKNIHKGKILSITCNISKSIPSEWILDSGATDHVTIFSHLFSSYKKIDPITVKLPIGHIVTTNHAGRVQFSQFLYLNDVLYIPTFQFNLISISKLLSCLPCNLTFMNDKCFI